MVDTPVPEPLPLTLEPVVLHPDANGMTSKVIRPLLPRSHHPMIGVSTVWTKENDRSGDPESMALIVYHPGLGEFPQRVVEGFTRGLQASGWSAVIWTASDSTPTDLTNFDLLVLGSPVYYWAPSRPVQGYLERVGDLR